MQREFHIRNMYTITRMQIQTLYSLFRCSSYVSYDKILLMTKVQLALHSYSNRSTHTSLGWVRSNSLTQQLRCVISTTLLYTE